MDVTNAQFIDSAITQYLDSTLKNAIDSVSAIMDSTTIQAIDSIHLHVLDSIVRHSVDSVTSSLTDSARAIVQQETATNWMTDLIWPAVIAGLVGFLLWLIQHSIEKRRREQSEREQFAKVWGLALYELREAISRALSFGKKARDGQVSLGVLYFANTVASDYFRLYVNLSVAEKMHWIYAMLHQIQVNLTTSRHHAEAGPGSPMVYTGAAAGFVKDHGVNLVSKFNFCLKEWQDYGSKYKVAMDVEIEKLEEPEDDAPKTDKAT